MTPNTNQNRNEFIKLKEERGWIEVPPLLYHGLKGLVFPLSRIIRTWINKDGKDPFFMIEDKLEKAGEVRHWIILSGQELTAMADALSSKLPNCSEEELPNNVFTLKIDK